MVNDSFGKNTLVPLILRLALAAIFIYHGVEKVGGGKHDWGANWTASLFTPREAGAAPETLQNHAVQLAVAWGELVGGAALLLGLLTRLAAAGLIVIQAGAIWMVTGPRGFGVEGGYEFNVSLVAMCLALILMGSGMLSLNYCFRRWRRQKMAVQTAPRGGESIPAGV